MGRATRAAASSAIDTSLSVEPDPSGVRLAGDHDDDEPDVYFDDEDDVDFEGSFFADHDANVPLASPALDRVLRADALACARVFRIYSRKSVDDGHGADITAKHDARYPDGWGRKGFGSFKMGGAK